MDDQYYRKVRPKEPSGGWLKKKLKNRNTVLTFLVVVPVASFMIFSNKGFLQRVRLESEKQEINEKIAKAKEEQKLLLEQSKALDKDPRAIEKVAREKYGMVKPGETVYKVKKEK